MSYHDTVLLKESIDLLEVQEGGVYVDVTYGGGGHSKELLSRVKNCSLFAFDQDEDALANDVNDDRLTLIHDNFSSLEKSLTLYQGIPADGLLADLGVSGHQFDEGSRGFSIRMDEPLDMRMGKSIKQNAKDLLHRSEKQEIMKFLRENSDLRRVGVIADAIKYQQGEGRMNTTGDLVQAVKKFAERGKENKLLAQVFQAIRIEVNNEINVLKELLIQSVKVLKPGGKLVVISYHSIEDRLVKNFMRSGNFEGEVETDLFGVPNSPLKVITRKPIVPSDAELQRNNRSRSAKLRVAEKV
ncbi:MAG: 16S rRNA (cytosine1402-N4)-methyltransferase [Glaciecola sp.]|jgi:16S rRNA (cytosine1402-N4)-methyltransferase